MNRFKLHLTGIYEREAVVHKTFISMENARSVTFVSQSLELICVKESLVDSNSSYGVIFPAQLGIFYLKCLSVKREDWGKVLFFFI